MVLTAAQAEPRPVRVGLMVRSTTLRAWQADVVRQLLAVPGVEIALLVVDARRPPPSTPVERVRRLLGSSHRVWDAYNNGWIGRRARSLRPVDLGAELGEVPRLEVVVQQRGVSELFPDDALAELRRHDLDLLLRFAFGIIRGEVLDVTRHGVWSFHHDDDDVVRGSPPAFWEIVQGQPVTGAILQRLTDRLDGGVVLDKGWFPTVAHSYLRNTDAVHLGATAWPARAVGRLQDHGEVTTARPSTSTAPLHRRPTDAQAAAFLARQAGRFVAAQARGVLMADHWEVGVVDAPIHRFLDPAFEPEVRWLRLGDPAEAYAADPFVLPGAEPATVLYERFDRRRRTGEIWRAELDGSAPPRPAGLPVTAHASYPFTFAHDGRTFCLPQVATPGTPLFELDDDRWRHVVDLVPGETVLDPTVVHHEGRWWLFGTRPGPWSLTTLVLWHAPELGGPWVPHRRNPVKTDVRSARPAGTPFLHEGRLYRPAQDCADGYGAGVAICEITRLDEDDLDERVVRVLRPGTSWPRSAGLHTLSAAGAGRTLLDARGPVLDVREALVELRARAARLRGSPGAGTPGHPLSAVRAGGDATPSVAPSPRPGDPPHPRPGVPPTGSGRGGRSDGLRVLAVIDALGEGGTERSLAETMPLLRADGIEVVVAILGSRGDEGVEPSLRRGGFDIRPLPGGRSRHRAWLALLDEVDPAVVHSMLFGANMVARRGRLQVPVPVLTSLVNTSYAPERLAAMPTGRHKLRVVQAADAVTGRLAVDRFHAVSASVRDDAVRRLRIPAERIDVIGRGRPDPRRHVAADARRAVRAALGIPPDARVVVNLGRHEHQKDQATLVRAVAPLLARHPDAWVLVAGREGNATPAVHRALAEVPAQDRRRLLLLGHRGDVAEVLAASDVFVMASHHEGMPGAVIEAMAAGLPVVASDIGPVHEVAVEGSTALVATPGDARSFTAAVEALLEDPVRRAAMGAAGRQVFEDRFTIEAVTSAMAALYREVASAGPRRRPR